MASLPLQEKQEEAVAMVVRMRAPCLAPHLMRTQEASPEDTVINLDVAEVDAKAKVRRGRVHPQRSSPERVVTSMVMCVTC